MLRLLLATALLVVGCTPGAPVGASQTPSVPPSVAGVTPVPATVVPATPAPSPTTTAPTTAPGTPGPAASCDPVYYDCEDKYTPRPPASAAATPTGPPATTEPTGDDLVVATSEDGTYLVSPDGMALYTYANDPPGTSTCNGECAQAWPALTVEPNQAVAGGEGVDGTLATTTRDDGSTQVTYNGAPLYNYKGDTAVGHMNGHGIAGVWYVAEP